MNKSINQLINKRRGHERDTQTYAMQAPTHISIM